MLENFIYAKEKSLFEEKLNNGEVLDEAIAFIEDTKEIWTHGSYFSNLDDVLKITEQSLTGEQKAQVKANLGIVESEGIEDAPADGNLYARKNKAWEILKNSNSEKFPILEEIASVLENESATKDEYDKISSFFDENKISRVDYDDVAYASFWLHGGLYVAEINKGDTTFYISISNVRIGTTEINSFGFALYEDLSFSLNYSNSYGIGSDDYGLYIQTESSYSGPKELFLQTSGDGTKFLSDTGEYKEIESGIPDARRDGNLYGRILGDWGVIKQDTLNAYDVSSDGQIFNFTKNLEKGIVQYAEIYNPLGTEVTVYIKRDTDTRKVEVKIAPGSTVLFRIISGIKGFYLEKVYYSSL